MWTHVRAYVILWACVFILASFVCFFVWELSPSSETTKCFHFRVCIRCWLDQTHCVFHARCEGKVFHVKFGILHHHKCYVGCVAMYIPYIIHNFTAPSVSTSVSKRKFSPMAHHKCHFVSKHRPLPKMTRDDQRHREETSAQTTNRFFPQMAADGRTHPIPFWQRDVIYGGLIGLGPKKKLKDGYDYTLLIHILWM